MKRVIFFLSAVSHLLCAELNLPKKYLPQKACLKGISSLGHRTWLIETDLGQYVYQIKSRSKSKKKDRTPSDPSAPTKNKPNPLQSWLDETRSVNIWMPGAEKFGIVALESLETGEVIFARSRSFSDNPLPSTDSRLWGLKGERCSGTNFLWNLLDHFSSVRHTTRHTREYGGKHGFVRLDALHPNEEWKQDRRTLFVVIFRNPYDWIRSLNNNPWVTRGLEGLKLSDFIRHRWTALFDKVGESGDINPATESFFENPMQLRTHKIREFLRLRNAPNSFFINYETVRDVPHAVLVDIANTFELALKGKFRPINWYKERRDFKYKPKKYPPISCEDRAFIRSELDPELEEQLGYTL